MQFGDPETGIPAVGIKAVQKRFLTASATHFDDNVDLVAHICGDERCRSCDDELLSETVSLDILAIDSNLTGTLQ